MTHAFNGFLDLICVDEFEDAAEPRLRYPLSLEDISYATRANGDGVDGVWTATPFNIPCHMRLSGPSDVFREQSIEYTHKVKRFVLDKNYSPECGDLGTMAIYIDGVCADAHDASIPGRGSCAFIFNDSDAGGLVSFRLGDTGPDGRHHAQTGNRADLRAAIEALGYRA